MNQDFILSNEEIDIIHSKFYEKYKHKYSTFKLLNTQLNQNEDKRRYLENSNYFAHILPTLSKDKVKYYILDLQVQKRHNLAYDNSVDYGFAFVVVEEGIYNLKNNTIQSQIISTKIKDIIINISCGIGDTISEIRSNQDFNIGFNKYKLKEKSSSHSIKDIYEYSKQDLDVNRYHLFMDPDKNGNYTSEVGIFYKHVNNSKDSINILDTTFSMNKFLKEDCYKQTFDLTINYTIDSYFKSYNFSNKFEFLYDSLIQY